MLESCIGVTGHRNPPGTRKSSVITHENGQKWPKSRILPMPLESCTGGHRASKSSRFEKIVGYNPRKQQKMAQITNFADAPIVVYRGSHGIEILSGPENRGLYPLKTARNGRNHEFCRCPRVVYRGPEGIKFLSEPKNRGL